MKKYLKYSGIVAAVVALVGWILIMACPVISTIKGNGFSIDVEAKGVTAIFGSEHAKLGFCALISWIFVLVAFLALAAAFVLPLFKVNVLDKWAGVINLAAMACLIISGIFTFCSKASFANANGMTPSNYGMGAGWVIAGILFLLAGALAILPAVFAFLDSKK